MSTSRIRYKQEEEDSREDFLSAKRQNPIANTVLTLAVVQKSPGVGKNEEARASREEFSSWKRGGGDH